MLAWVWQDLYGKSSQQKHVISSENETSHITVNAYLTISGITSEVRGTFSVNTSMNTVRPKRIVMTSEILSPDSGGKLNEKTVSTPSTTHGKIKLVK